MAVMKRYRVTEKNPFVKPKKSDVRKTKMSEIVSKIKKIDQSLTRAVANFVSKNKRTPTELDLMKDSVAVPLITQRKRLVKQYNYLKQEIKFAENTYTMIKGDNPIKRAKRSFQGITPSNPFSGNKEYQIDNKSVPALSPIRRVGTNSNKMGTLWDPRFNAGDITVDPKIARYYKKLTGGF
jgi:hypothetical protein